MDSYFVEVQEDGIPAVPVVIYAESAVDAVKKVREWVADTLIPANLPHLGSITVLDEVLPPGLDILFSACLSLEEALELAEWVCRVRAGLQ